MLYLNKTKLAGLLLFVSLTATLAAKDINVSKESLAMKSKETLPQVEIWKSTTCSCCGNWVKHMEESGFTVKVNLLDNYTQFRKNFPLPVKYASCHVGKVGDYLLEGHIPADDVKKLLTQKPEALGIAVPGMPIGSPGMDGPEYKGVKHQYDTLLVDKKGNSTKFATHN